MKCSRLIAVVVLLAASAVLLWAVLPSPPRLTIQIHGSPAANITVTDYQAMLPRKTDSTGSITIEGDPEKQHGVLVPMQGGTHRQVPFPVKGHATVDLRKRYVRRTTVYYDYGVVRSEETTEQFDLTDEEVAAIEAGETTTEQVQQAIRDEAGP
ncbi:MAG: hypothetical protein KJ000_10965 [Pirellulaceae bacterium]|nr:hypothetical protein [Pirellulaceae bacterium]